MNDAVRCLCVQAADGIKTTGDHSAYAAQPPGPRFSLHDIAAEGQIFPNLRKEAYTRRKFCRLFYLFF